MKLALFMLLDNIPLIVQSLYFFFTIEAFFCIITTFTILLQVHNNHVTYQVDVKTTTVAGCFVKFTFSQNVKKDMIILSIWVIPNYDR